MAEFSGGGVKLPDLKTQSSLRPRQEKAAGSFSRTEVSNASHLGYDERSPDGSRASGTIHNVRSRPGDRARTSSTDRRQQVPSSLPAVAAALSTPLPDGANLLWLCPAPVPPPGHAPAVPAGRRASLRRQVPAGGVATGTTAPRLEPDSKSQHLPSLRLQRAGGGAGGRGAIGGGARSPAGLSRHLLARPCQPGAVLAAAF